MKCLRCNRKITKPTAAGFGAVCARKAAAEQTTAAPKIRIEILHNTPARRSYLVFTSPRFRVVVINTSWGKSVACDCHSGECEHIRAIRETDDRLSPITARRGATSQNGVNQNV